MNQHIEVVIFRKQLKHFSEVFFIKLFLIRVGKILPDSIQNGFIETIWLIVLFFQYSQRFVNRAWFSVLNDVSHVGRTNVFANAILHPFYIFTGVCRNNAVQIVSHINEHRPVVFYLTWTCIHHLRKQVNQFHCIQSQMKTTKDSQIVNEYGSWELILVKKQPTNIVIEQRSLVTEERLWNSLCHFI